MPLNSFLKAKCFKKFVYLVREVFFCWMLFTQLVYKDLLMFKWTIYFTKDTKKKKKIKIQAKLFIFPTLFRGSPMRRIAMHKAKWNKSFPCPRKSRAVLFMLNFAYDALEDNNYQQCCYRAHIGETITMTATTTTTTTDVDNARHYCSVVTYWCQVVVKCDTLTEMKEWEKGSNTFKFMDHNCQHMHPSDFSHVLRLLMFFKHRRYRR